MGIKGSKKNLGLILSGQPVLIPSANIYITQPKVKDIVMFGEDDFLTAIQLLIDLSQFSEMIKKGNSDLVFYSDFQLLLMIISEDATVNKLISKLFELLFPEYNFNITENTIDFSIREEDSQQIIGRLYPFNYEEFQNTLNDLFIPKSDNEREPDYNPANAAAEKIAQKIKAGRKKVHAQKAAIEGEHSIFADYCSTLSIGMNMDINILYNYTSFQLYDAYRRYFAKSASDFYMRISSMPMMDTSKMEAPPDWNRNLY